MRLAKENLGKVSVTVEKAYHSIDKEYDKLVVVEEEGQFRTFISRKPVPIGIELTDREFWLPFSGVKESIVIDYNKFKQYIRTGEGLLDDSIVTRHIKSRNITGDKIAEETITFVNIANEAVTLPKINKEAIDTTLTKEGYLAEAKHTGERLLNVEGLTVIKLPSTQSTILDAWQIIDKKGNVHGVTINTYKDKSIDAIWLSINENDPQPEDSESKVNNPRYLNIIYNKADGTQQKVSIPLASFVTEAEFSKNGFKVIDGVVNLKISSDITTSRYFHFDTDGNITLDGFEDRILEDLGTLEHSNSGDGTMWGEFKKQEAIREEISNSSHQVFSDNWDKEDDNPEEYDPLSVIESSYTYNWKTADNPASDGKTEGNLKDLYQKTLNQDSKLSELEGEVLYKYQLVGRFREAYYVSTEERFETKNSYGNFEFEIGENSKLHVEIPQYSTWVGRICWYGFTSEKVINFDAESIPFISIKAAELNKDYVDDIDVPENAKYIYITALIETKDNVICEGYSSFKADIIKKIEDLTEDIEGKLTSKESVSYEITPANYSAYDGNKVWDSQQLFPVGAKLSKLKIASTGSVSPKYPILYIVNNSNNIEYKITLNKSVAVEDTEFDLTQYNIFVKDGYKYLVECCSNSFVGSSLTGRYFYLASDGFKNYDKYNFGFAFTYEIEKDKLDILSEGITSLSTEFNTLSEEVEVVNNNVIEIKQKVDEIEIDGVGLNLFNKHDVDIIPNKAFNKASGNIVDFANAYITGFIPIEYGKTYSFSDYTWFLGSTYNRSVSLYDENKNFVGGYFYEVSHTDNVINTFTNNNSSAKYARVVGYYSRIGSFMFVEGSSLPSKYAPFGEYKYINTSLLPSDYPFIRMFRKVAGIGDSLMSGCIQRTNTDAHDYNNVSWLSFISYDSGATATHYSTGGYTAKNWIDGDGGHKAKLASDPKSWAYFIGFGTNDSSPSKASYPIGDVTDAAGTDSFVGYYKQIIEYVHTQAPNAKIFCMSTYRVSEPYGEIVGKIAKLYDYCYFIDIIKCSDVTLFSDSGYVSYDHFTTQGYLALAKNIAKEVNRIIAENMQDFIYVGYDNN